MDLAAISEPELVLPTIAQVLEVKETAGQPLLQSVQAHLQDRQLLLLLDNFEQVLAAGLVVSDLLTAAPRLRVLVTSRISLHLRGEHEVAVGPLSLPGAPVRDLEQLRQYDAVRLFIERAQAVTADFHVTNANAPAVAEICVRLEGLPLAIELAAARVKLLPPEALLARLSDRLQLLTGGQRDLPARQQTIRATIDWSYDLLDQAEQQVFIRFAVFVSGWTLEAAEAIGNAAGDLPGDLLDGLQSLVDKSLIQQHETTTGMPRFTMLETMREYGLEHLVRQGELATLQQVHADYYLRVAQACAMEWQGPREADALQHIDSDLSNIRAALQWVQDTGDAERVLRLVKAVAWFWHTRGYFAEWRRWLETALGYPHAGSDADHGYLYNQAGWHATLTGDVAAAEHFFAASLARVEDVRMQCNSLRGLGYLYRSLRDWARAEDYIAQSLTISRAAGDQEGVGSSLLDLGAVANQRGDLSRALALIEEALGCFRQGQVPYYIANTLGWLGRTRVLTGDLIGAALAFREEVQIFGAYRNSVGLVTAFEGLALIRRAQGDAVGGARLLGVADQLRTVMGTPLGQGEDLFDQQVYAAHVEYRHVLQNVWVEGRTMPLVQAVAYALEDVPEEAA